MKTILIEGVLPVLFVLLPYLLTGTVHSQGLSNLKRAIFAGGCFWCMEKAFEELDGVISVTSGYTGGSTENPDYNNYAEGGHVEAIEVLYDPDKIGYEKLLELFWRQIDPTDPDGQFVDRGKAYSTGIFYLDENQKILAEKSKKELEDTGIFKKRIITPIIPASRFYNAEDYHQDYYKKSPVYYKNYQSGSGRDEFLKEIWDNSPVNEDEADLKKRLTSLQYHVTREEGTETPFENEYWDNKKPGIYVDIVSGEPLFSSTHKYESGTGWPSFTRPIDEKNITTRVDKKTFPPRTEVRSKGADSHLGHVFTDGPPPTGLRYCINSAALRFVPVDDLEKEGYGELLILFE